MLYLTVHTTAYNSRVTIPPVNCKHTDCQLDLDNLSVNVIHTQPDDNTLSHCPTLIQYVLKVKNSKHKLTAMLDCGSGVSGISDKCQGLIELLTCLSHIKHQIL